MKRIKSNLTSIILLIFVVLSPGISMAQVSSCSSIFSTDEFPTSGASRGPLEWIINLKMKGLPSSTVKKFDEAKYNDAVTRLKAVGARIDEGYIPKSLEEYVAYLDIQLSDLNIKITNMEPIFRHKIYKAINEILQQSSGDPLYQSQYISDLIFRGSTARPSSFKYLLTHSPEAASRELFVQHIYSLAIARTVTESLEFSPGPRKPGLVQRITPQFVKDNKEILSASLWSGLGIATSVQSEIFNYFLGSMNIFKLYSNKVVIEKTFSEKGFNETLRVLEPQFTNKSQYGYSYLVAEKTLNWVILILVGIEFYQ